MSLTFHPAPGSILLCDYWHDAQAPEMVKRRPVVIVSPRARKGSGIAIVVPLSTTAPKVVLPVHVRIVLGDALPKPFDAVEMWAKCDLPNAVSLARLDRFRERADGQRSYRSGLCSDQQLTLIRQALAHALGMPFIDVL